MKIRIRQWGNSLALRIPRSCAIELKIEPGSVVKVSVEGGQLVTEAVAENDYTLEELLAGVTQRNLHGETNAGSRRGKRSGDGLCARA